MGIDLHAMNLIGHQARLAPLGKVLTIGRQSMSVPAEALLKQFGDAVPAVGFCEPLLMALGADDVESVDYSDYESATHIADMSHPISLAAEYDTVIDSGSLEHVFDVAAAFRNVIGFCKVGGHILHVLPVNNLSGHGFWQFSSDLMYSIYSEANGFSGTQVCYASSLDHSRWYKVPEARRGVRVELVSIEPIVLLCVTRKVRKVDSLSVVQPFYAPTWASAESGEPAPFSKHTSRRLLLSLIPRGAVRNYLRNGYRILDLCFGLSGYSLRNSSFETVVVPRVISRRAQ